MDENNLKSKLAILIIFFLFLFYFGGTENISKIKQQDKEILKNVDIKPINANDLFLGGPNSEVFIVNFIDTRASTSREFYFKTVDVLKKYVEMGNVAFVYRPFPIKSIDNGSFLEAEAILCANSVGEQIGFWKYLKERMSIVNEDLIISVLPDIAEIADIDIEKFKLCQKNNNYEDTINENIQGALNIGMTESPFAVIVNKNGQGFVLDKTASSEEIDASIKYLLSHK
ncbi:MAG: hypothetical protein UT05_C0009G0038 [Parcubacteria group bacterium GW2011_GWF2_38_76]|nr:MAG: hypothetical protein UT05_C0009G0038 [Parcubacteria group bacterium GW2011_GWF2_38_76]